MCTATTSNVGHQLENIINEPLIKIEVNDDDPIIPFMSEIVDEPNFAVVEPKSELIYENQVISDTENSFYGLRQSDQNPFGLLKRLTPKETRSTSLDADSAISDHTKLGKSTEIQPTATVTHLVPERNLHECKLCSKQLESEAQLQIHVGICALYHKDRNRFCVPCNRKFCETKRLEGHRLRFHGTEQEKLSLYAFKCHVCSKQFRHDISLRLHLESHKKKKQEKVKTSKSIPLKCSQPKCVQEFTSNQGLRRHISAVHFGVRPFRCSFPNCDQAFSIRGHLTVHLRIHTGERPFKCTVDNCNKAFMTPHKRSVHHQSVHCNL